ncbi:hypothetical protein AVEN_239638-1 [Araneus ventricosus]|uniref:Uncharacterized protein n=1 Tax=Araneus ventricosus TaxID=182803 RepID=A0A4Y2MIG8_ARAVE|nr:hypothetical protein AVEN_239638-1 [Araneus ventricosus]
MSHMSVFPEFFVRSRSVKCEHHPSILHFPPILMKITLTGACAKARRVSESVAKQYIFLACTRGRSGLVVRSRPRDRRVAGSKPDSTEDPLCMEPVARQIIRSGQTSSCWCGAEAWPAQVPSSSSDSSSKLRGKSLNSPRVASKRDVNIT